MNQYETEQIEKLPVAVAALREKFPLLVVNLAEVWNEPPITEQPRFIEVFYGDDKPSIVFKDGNLEKYLPQGSDNSLIAIYGDEELIYCEYEGREIKNRMGKITLPEELTNPVEMVKASIQEVV